MTAEDIHTSLQPWLVALHTSSQRLTSAVGGLSDEELSRPSFAGEWSIAQVLSHLGSGAEISAGLLERGLAGCAEPPGRDDLTPIRDRWNDLAPGRQREQWVKADARHLRILDELGDVDHSDLRVPCCAGSLDMPTYAGYRLSEQSVHAWDVEVALDPGSAIPAAETALLWERIDLVATRFRDGATLSRLAPAGITVNRTDRPRPAGLLLASELHLYPCEPAEPTGSLVGSTEALVRLVYGRNRPEHDGLTASGPLEVRDLRALFPGF